MKQSDPYLISQEIERCASVWPDQSTFYLGVNVKDESTQSDYDEQVYQSNLIKKLTLGGFLQDFLETLSICRSYIIGFCIFTLIPNFGVQKNQND